MTTFVPGSPSPVRLAPVIVNAPRKAFVAPDCTGEGLGGEGRRGGPPNWQKRSS
jgi:hypothetical protein